MALIKINNTAQAISDASELATNATELSSVTDSIEYILGEIGAYWEQSQEDAQSFTKGLEQNVETLQTIVECNKEFSQVIEKYAENQEKTGQNTAANI